MSNYRYKCSFCNKSFSSKRPRNTCKKCNLSGGLKLQYFEAVKKKFNNQYKVMKARRGFSKKWMKNMKNKILKKEIWEEFKQNCKLKINPERIYNIVYICNHPEVAMKSMCRYPLCPRKHEIHKEENF